MHHGHYPKVIQMPSLQSSLTTVIIQQIAPVVRQFCLEKGIPYKHFDSLWANTAACASHLANMGSSDVPDAARNLSAAKHE